MPRLKIISAVPPHLRLPQRRQDRFAFSLNLRHNLFTVTALFQRFPLLSSSCYDSISPNKYGLVLGRFAFSESAPSSSSNAFLECEASSMLSSATHSLALLTLSAWLSNARRFQIVPLSFASDTLEPRIVMSDQKPQHTPSTDPRKPGQTSFDDIEVESSQLHVRRPLPIPSPEPDRFTPSLSRNLFDTTW
jgi:hypothetical protein